MTSQIANIRMDRRVVELPLKATKAARQNAALDEVVDDQIGTTCGNG